MKLFNSLLVCCFLLLSAAASAHTGIQSSLPKNGAVLKQSPKVIDLRFRGLVRLIRLELKDAEGESINLALPTAAEPSKDFSILLPDLKPSTYQVNWVSAGADGHKINGKFGFKYTDNNVAANGSSTDHQNVSQSNFSVWILATILIKLLIYIAFAMTVGGLAGMFTLSRYRDRQIPFIHYLPLGCLLGLIAVSVRFFLQVGSFAELGLAGMWNSDYAEILWHSGVGQSYRWQLMGWCLIVFMMLMIWLKPALTHLFTTLSFIGVLMIGASFTLTGHTADAPIWVRVALSLHVVMAMWWIGSLYPLRSACDVLNIPNLKSLMVEFGELAMFLVSLLVVAGIGVAYHLEGSFSNLIDTGHGNILLLKFGTVIAMLLIAALHKLHLAPSLATLESAKSLKRSITKEMWIGFVILLLTAVMSTVTGPAFG